MQSVLAAACWNSPPAARGGRHDEALGELRYGAAFAYGRSRSTHIVAGPGQAELAMRRRPPTRLPSRSPGWTRRHLSRSVTKAPAICDEGMGLDEFQFGCGGEWAEHTVGKEEHSPRVLVARTGGLGRIQRPQQTAFAKVTAFYFF